MSLTCSVEPGVSTAEQKYILGTPGPPNTAAYFEVPNSFFLGPFTANFQRQVFFVSPVSTYPEYKVWLDTRPAQHVIVLRVDKRLIQV